MKRYEINTAGADVRLVSNNAGTKAPDDADQIYALNGFTVIRLPNSAWMHKLRLCAICRILFAIALPLRFNRNSEVHVQLTGSRIDGILARLVRRRAGKTVLLVHDVSFLRRHRMEEAHKEIKLYNSAGELIVHTPSMAAILREQGATVPMKVLQVFDYLSRTNETYTEPDLRSIVFAGNLGKSAFLGAWLREAESWRLPIYLYGAGALPETDGRPFLRYEGCFAPDDLSHIKGAWGLVWDGADPDSCDSYLKYNAPHKLSLYLAAQKPLIVWRQSALYAFVASRKIGIAIDSLTEIPARLSAITTETYLEYLQNVQAVAGKLRSGSFLSACLA
jgi:hypothetical protein